VISEVVDDYLERFAHAPASVRRITADMVADHTEAPRWPRSIPALERIEAAGVLAPAGNIRGTGVWLASDIIAALDNFAARTVRRTWH
jgi:hypothetical protein